MRLLIVSYFFEAPAGGGVIVARLLAEQLRERGHSVDVLCLAGCSDPQPGPLLRMTAPPGFRSRVDRLRQVLLFLNNPGFDRYFLRQARGLTATTGPYDFILAQDFLGMRVVASLADHWGIPCGATLQDTLPQQVDVGARNPTLKTLLRTLSHARDRSLVRDLQAYDWLAAISRHVAASAKAWLQPTLPAIPVIPNPVPEDFRRLAPPHPSDTTRFLFVGRLSPEKGVDLLVEAFRRLPSDHRLTIVGLKGSLSRKIAEIAAADSRIRIEPPSPYHAMPQVYGRHEIVCCPAMWDEPFGLTVLEGRASQRVVIGTRRGGLLEILEGYPRSLFFDANPADRDSTVDRLTQALIKAPSLLGQPLDPAMENEFVRGMELPSVVDRYEELIRDAVARPRHKRGG